MELREFIARALCDIVEGVRQAQDATKVESIVPPVDYKADGHSFSNITPIEFEVTVKTDETKGSEAKLNVVAAVIGGSVKGESGSSSGHAATLRFQVPVKFRASLHRG